MCTVPGTWCKCCHVAFGKCMNTYATVKLFVFCMFLFFAWLAYWNCLKPKLQDHAKGANPLGTNTSQNSGRQHACGVKPAFDVKFQNSHKFVCLLCIWSFATSQNSTCNVDNPNDDMGATTCAYVYPKSLHLKMKKRTYTYLHIYIHTIKHIYIYTYIDIFIFAHIHKYKYSYFQMHI